MAHVFISLRQLAQAQQVAQSAVDALHPRTLDKKATQEAFSLYGAFHLVLAVVAARENERQQAQHCLQVARDSCTVGRGPERLRYGVRPDERRAACGVDLG
jgi:hypothetical protein